MALRFERPIAHSSALPPGRFQQVPLAEANANARRGRNSPASYIEPPSIDSKPRWQPPYVQDLNTNDDSFERELEAPRPSQRHLSRRGDTIRSSTTASNPTKSSGGTPQNQQALPAHADTDRATRTISVASRTTSNGGTSLFRDFDGVHCSSVARESTDAANLGGTVEEDHTLDGGNEEEEEKEGMHETSPASVANVPMSRDLGVQAEQPDKSNEEKVVNDKVDIMPAVQQQSSTWAQPPPTENMVYYPAPVPKNLNMPKKLSKKPSPSVIAKRKQKVMETMSLEARQSAAASHVPPHKKGLNLKMQRLPPQLRANVFFDHDPIPHKIQVKGDSAVATLDNLLDASARAAANHSPADLDLSAASSNGHSRTRSRGLSSLFDAKSVSSKSRISLLSFKKSSSGSVPQSKNGDEDEKEISREDNTPAADVSNDQDDENRSCQGTVGEEFDDSDHTRENSLYPFEAGSVVSTSPFTDDHQHGTPTTLLSELQMRKMQLKSRSRTAATAFPNGMRSTLLELEAVEQIEKQRRKDKRVTLAWEDPATSGSREVEAGDNVPLGVLFPAKDSLMGSRTGADRDRPPGLIVRRQIEDNEPLSMRRNRLMGVDPNRQTLQQTAQASLIADEEPQSEHEDETLAQRTRRLGLKNAGGEAINAGKRKSSNSEVMPQSGNPEDVKIRESTEREPKPEPLDGETLGQRRSRLQAQAQAGLPTEYGQRVRVATGRLAQLSPTERASTIRLVLRTPSPVRVPDRREESQLRNLSDVALDRNQQSKDSQHTVFSENQHPYIEAGQVHQQPPNQGISGLRFASQTSLPSQGAFANQSFMGGQPQFGFNPVRLPIMASRNGFGTRSAFDYMMKMQNANMSQQQLGHFPPNGMGYPPPVQAMPMMQPIPAFKMASGHGPDAGSLSMSWKQRENINRWRQSVQL